MHFYPFNIGDYMSHTSRLTLLEDLAYRRMIDLYYLHERPLNGCSTEVGRDIGMMDNIDEIEYILKKFFSLTPDGYINNRIEEELSKYQQKVSNAQKAGLASAKARASKSKLTSVERPLNNRATKQETRNKKQESKEAKASPRTRFVKPTEKDVDNYAKEKSLNLEGFFNYYESIGWVVGKTGKQMKNWKASASGWSNRQKHYYPTGMEPSGSTSHKTVEENQKYSNDVELLTAQRHGFDTVAEYNEHLYKEQMKRFGQEV